MKAIAMPVASNIFTSVNEFPMDAVRSFVVPNLSMNGGTLTPLSARSTTFLPSPVRLPSSLVHITSAT